MPTIKRKVEMNLPQLIEWAKNNEIKNRMVLTKDSYCVGFDRHGYIYFNSTLTMPLDQVFTVEIEEEITEDTVIPRLFVRYVYESFAEKYEVSLTDVYTPNVKAVYLSNNDLTMTLIWTKEEGLVS